MTTARRREETITTGRRTSKMTSETASKKRITRDITGARLINIENMLKRMLFSNMYAGAPEGAASAANNESEPGKSYMDTILSTQIEYNPRVISALKDFKRDHKTGNESNEDRLEGMRILLAEIASAHNVQAPILEMADITGGDSFKSHYDTIANKIVMHGKLSIITFLHEVAHAIFGYDEHEARCWSINLFKHVYPKAFARLKVENGFILKVQDSTVVSPVVSTGNNPC